MKKDKVYKNKDGEVFLNELYDRQLKSLNIKYDDLFINTRFGQSHIIKCGNPYGKPLLLFHGGNCTTPYYLIGLKMFFDHFCIYAVDTIGHPGKSDKRILSTKNKEYGEWALDVINGLGFQKMNCMGGSYGGGILVKLMCVAPEKIEKSVLIVPSGIANVSTFNVLIKMGIPMLFYTLTKNEYWLRKAILPMAIEEKNINTETYEMVKNAFDFAKVKTKMPCNEKMDMLKNCIMPILLIAAEHDCIFPGSKVIKKAKKILPDLRSYLLNNQGHLCTLPVDVMNMIIKFIDE
jgi:pimeloyl-ACP methyl ester carboxylesterase